MIFLFFSRKEPRFLKKNFENLHEPTKTRNKQRQQHRKQRQKIYKEMQTQNKATWKNKAA